MNIFVDDLMLWLEQCSVASASSVQQGIGSDGSGNSSLVRELSEQSLDLSPRSANAVNRAVDDLMLYIEQSSAASSSRHNSNCDLGVPREKSLDLSPKSANEVNRAVDDLIRWLDQSAEFTSAETSYAMSEPLICDPSDALSNYSAEAGVSISPTTQAVSHAMEDLLVWLSANFAIDGKGSPMEKDAQQAVVLAPEPAPALSRSGSIASVSTTERTISLAMEDALSWIEALSTGNMMEEGEEEECRPHRHQHLEQDQSLKAIAGADQQAADRTVESGGINEKNVDGDYVAPPIEAQTHLEERRHLIDERAAGDAIEPSSDQDKKGESPTVAIKGQGCGHDDGISTGAENVTSIAASEQAVFDEAEHTEISELGRDIENRTVGTAHENEINEEEKDEKEIMLEEVEEVKVDVKEEVKVEEVEEMEMEEMEEMDIKGVEDTEVEKTEVKGVEKTEVEEVKKMEMKEMEMEVQEVELEAEEEARHHHHALDTSDKADKITQETPLEANDTNLDTATPSKMRDIGRQRLVIRHRR